MSERLRWRLHIGGEPPIPVSVLENLSGSRALVRFLRTENGTMIVPRRLLRPEPRPAARPTPEEPPRLL